MALQSEKQISVADFTATKQAISKIQCRGAGQFTFPSGENAETYLTNALKKELTYAGLYADNGSIKISGNINHFDVSSNVGVAGWSFDVTLSNGADNFNITYKHRVKTSWMADRACAAVAEQFVDAAQAFTQQVTSHPKFISWLK